MTGWLLEKRQRGCTRRLQQPRTHADRNWQHASRVRKHRLVGVAVYETFELRLRAEVEQQPHFDVRRAKVVEKLLSIAGSQTLRCLELDDDLVLDRQVDSVVTDLDALKPNVKAFLAFNGQLSASQHVRQCASIDRLEKAKAEPIVHVEKSTDDLARQAFLLEEPVRVCPRSSHPRKSALTLFGECNQTIAQGIARLH